MTGKGAGRRGKKPNPLADPPILVTAVMILLVVELVLYAAVGWVWLIVINCVGGVVVWVALLAWRRRGKGGLLDRLLGLLGVGDASSRSGASRNPSPGGASRRPSASGSASPGASRRNPLSRLLNPGGASPDASRRRGGPGAGRRGRQPGASRASGTPGDASGRKKPRLWPFGGSKKKPGGTGTPGGSKSPSGQTRDGSGSGGGKKPSPKRKGPGVWDEFVLGFDDKRAEKKAEKADKGSKRPTDEPEEQPAPKRAKDEKRPAPAPQRGEETPMGIRHEDDASLQRWGRNLKSVSPAIDEVATTARQQGDVIDAIAEGVRKLAEQGENDLPAAKTLTAEAEAIAVELRRLREEEEERANRLRSLAARSEALAIRYGQDHEVDEARLSGERGGRAREKRADVTAAEQDT